MGLKRTEMVGIKLSKDERQVGKSRTLPSFLGLFVLGSLRNNWFFLKLWAYQRIVICP